VSKGPGRLMRRIVTLLEQAPQRELTRKALDDTLIAEGFFLQNVPRAIRSLSRRRLVFLKDRHSRGETIVRLPQEVPILSDDEIGEILMQLGDGK
jgi:hypothetical protein